MVKTVNEENKNKINKFRREMESRKVWEKIEKEISRTQPSSPLLLNDLTEEENPAQEAMRQKENPKSVEGKKRVCFKKEANVSNVLDECEMMAENPPLNLATRRAPGALTRAVSAPQWRQRAGSERVHVKWEHRSFTVSP